MERDHRPSTQDAFISQKLVPGPTIIYDSTLDSPDRPYKINVDKQKCVNLLRRLKVPESIIEDLQIHVLRNNKNHSVFGHFDSKTRSIEIFADPIFMLFNRTNQRLSEMISKTRVVEVYNISQLSEQ